MAYSLLVKGRGRARLNCYPKSAQMKQMSLLNEFTVNFAAVSQRLGREASSKDYKYGAGFNRAGEMQVYCT